MARILLIETSTALCSVAVSIDGTVVASRRDPGRAHASLTAVFCDDVLKEAGILPVDSEVTGVTGGGLDAVCISEGPGSYTGLRVGLSTAKGICFGTGARLLSVGSLDVLAEMARCGVGMDADAAGKIIPMIDARRMEVYTAIYSEDGVRLTPVEAKVIDNESAEDYEGDCIFIGDGALKCREVIEGCSPENPDVPHKRFIDACPDAAYMGRLAEEQFRLGAFRDVAYFEPFYLKDFVVTTSKKKLF